MNNLPPARLRVEEAAKYLGMGVSTLDKMRVQGRGPRYLKVGNRVFYRESDLAAFLDAAVVETTDSRAYAG
ncbi:helix-turn-helix transcriptional regulator [Stenotrophomonas indicatrix]|uniref:helix-turn-helix transcriptional regulator n=1 Tax=Stenotrophomonas indicatrix TaxID=2045451 RepID=UPI001CBAFB3D|nr:helix-turn-helix domain-containing protein [Stenotrophomonas indicatrix]